MQSATDLRKELCISPAVLLRSPSLFDMLQALFCLTHPQSGDTECAGRQLAKRANVSEHVILGARGHSGSLLVTLISHRNFVR